MQTFNRNPQGDENNDRKTLAHNLGKIFEGVTISYVQYDLNKIKPFILFARDSEGGVSSLFLPTVRYIQNITLQSGYIYIVFCIDATGSMGSWLQAAKERSHDIAKTSRSKYNQVSFRFGALFCRDPIDCSDDKNEYISPTEDISNLVNFMATQVPDGGGDTPEGWVGADDILLNHIVWRDDASKAIIHIADAPANGSDWGKIQNSLLYPLIE